MSIDSCERCRYYVLCDCGSTARWLVSGYDQTPLSNVGWRRNKFYCDKHLPDDARAIHTLQHLGDLA